jgi:hypothetical protein
MKLSWLIERKAMLEKLGGCQWHLELYSIFRLVFALRMIKKVLRT